MFINIKELWALKYYLSKNVNEKYLIPIILNYYYELVININSENSYILFIEKAGYENNYFCDKMKSNKIDWDRISCNFLHPENFLEKFGNNINWKNVYFNFISQHVIYSKNFLIKYIDKFEKVNYNICEYNCEYDTCEVVCLCFCHNFYELMSENFIY